MVCLRTQDCQTTNWKKMRLNKKGDIRVTVPRTYADIIVTEWGIARLAGKSNRERAEELITIAQPDFRDELRNEAGKLFWP